MAAKTKFGQQLIGSLKEGIRDLKAGRLKVTTVRRNVFGRTSNCGRPPKYVQYLGKTIVGLSLKQDGRYYSTHNHPITGKRVYFGRNLEQAVKAYRLWQRSLEAV